MKLQGTEDAADASAVDQVNNMKLRLYQLLESLNRQVKKTITIIRGSTIKQLVQFRLTLDVIYMVSMKYNPGYFPLL